jgi:hypothetical protein
MTQGRLIETVAPIVIRYCIEFLQTRPIGTMYHPDHDTYVLDGRVIAKILHYDGNLMASPDPYDQRDYSHMLSYLVDTTPIIHAPEPYRLTHHHSFSRISVKLEKVIKPKFIGARYVGETESSKTDVKL